MPPTRDSAPTASTGPAGLGGPRGLGTSAAQIVPSLLRTAPQRLRSFTHVPFTDVSAVHHPDIYMPYPLSLSPHLEPARENVIAWAHRVGVLDGLIWDEPRMRAYDLPLCAAGIHPDATAEQLDITSGWLAWGTYGDDLYPVVYGRTHDLAGARVATARLSRFMPVEDADLVPTDVPVTGLERGLADLWTRTAGPMTVAARRRFRQAIEDMTDSWIWELVNMQQNRVPDPIDYVEMRRKTFGSDLTMSLSRLAHGNTVPDEVYASRPVRALENSAADYACLLNDVFSFQKEIQFEGEVHNCVLVVQNFLDCDADRAMDVVNNVMTARLQQFQHVLDVEFPVLFTEFDLDEAARNTLLGYAAELKNWVAGILNWHEGCHRYTEADLYRHFTPKPAEFGLPSGLGTTSARLVGLLGTR